MSPYASPNDHRQYHYLELANRLRVLLICDPDTDKSAASLAVNTGHFDDPADRQGWLISLSICCSLAPALIPSLVSTSNL